MVKTNMIQLKIQNILEIIQQSNNDNFTFIINGEEYKTTRVIANLLSPKIFKSQLVDSTINTFTINTNHIGNFSLFFELLNFQPINIMLKELNFVAEVSNKLGNESIELYEKEKMPTISIENVFALVKEHEQYGNFYYKRLVNEIDFISRNFFQTNESQRREMMDYNVSTLCSIFENKNLNLESEDQLLKFINEAYTRDPKYSILYDVVQFSNVSSELMEEFIKIFDMNDLSTRIWNSLCSRLREEIHYNEADGVERCNSNKSFVKTFSSSNNSEFNGIINYLVKSSKENIDKEIIIKSSSVNSTNEFHQPINVVLYDNDYYYYSQNLQKSWISFDFRNRRIVPTEYTIKSGPWKENGHHLKNWVLEGSVDNESWKIIDEEKDSSFLNGKHLYHTFKIENNCSDKFRFIRIHSTGLNWNNNNYLSLDSFEIFGDLYN